MNKLPGIKEAEVNLLTGSMVVVHDENRRSESEIIAAVEQAGYGAVLSDAAERVSTQRDSTVLKRRFLSSLFFMIPLLVIHHFDLGTPMIQGILLLPILWLNRRFFTSGFLALFKKAPNMDTLIALGSGAAVVYSAIAIFLLHEQVVYLESAGMILTLITFGKWLEARATGQTGAALEKLHALLPDSAILLRDGKQLSIPADEVRTGDRLFIPPGAKIPVDGEVVRGYSNIDESAFTGESMPVSKSPGSQVYAGTLNGHGTLEILALRPRAQSAISDIIAMVSEAAAAKAPIARVADRISGIFVPLVVLTACVTATLWLLCGYSTSFALGNAIAVLVISCPCALGLATPVAIMAGAGKGAQYGILFRSGEVLEKASAATTVILDKTGTITTGSPTVTDVIPSGCSRNELLHTAAALETVSQHPLAKAIQQAIGPTCPSANITQASYLPGLGICALVGETPCYIGNAALLKQQGIEADAKLGLTLARQGKTPVFVAADKQYLGCIAVADPIRPDSAEAVHQLQRAGLKVIMMTGDHPETARAVAAKVGIEEVYAEVRPGDKADKVQLCRQQGQQVIMVGDGVNDAPALTRADVGIAIGTGTDVAIESAGIILLRSRLSDVPAAMKLSSAVIRNIRQNLFWAFFYNVLSIPLAAGLYYPLFGWTLTPGIAAAAMSLSSLCVVCNALRLNRLSLDTTSENNTMKNTIIIRVSGMMCPHCERHMTEALLALQGVISCRADHKSSTVELELTGPADENILQATVTHAGYTYGGIIK